MAQITTIHNLSAIDTAEINPDAEFMINNDPTAVVRANKVNLSQIKSDLANKDLSNLSQTGESHFADKSLSNLDASGESLFTAKANIGLDNLSNTGKAIIPSLAMPDASHTTSESISGSGTYYTAPADGYYYFTGQGVSNTNTYIELIVVSSTSSTTAIYGVGAYSSTSNVMKITLPVAKGAVVYMTHANGVTGRVLTFVYAKGAN